MSATFTERLIRKDIELYKIRPDEIYEEGGEDGMPIRIVIEHLRCGQKYYRIIWRSDAEPVVEDEAAE